MIDFARRLKCLCFKLIHRDVSNGKCHSRKTTVFHHHRGVKVVGVRSDDNYPPNDRSKRVAQETLDAIAHIQYIYGKQLVLIPTFCT